MHATSTKRPSTHTETTDPTALHRTSQPLLTLLVHPENESFRDAITRLGSPLCLHPPDDDMRVCRAWLAQTYTRDSVAGDADGNHICDQRIMTFTASFLR